MKKYFFLNHYTCVKTKCTFYLGYSSLLTIQMYKMDQFFHSTKSTCSKTIFQIVILKAIPTFHQLQVRNQRGKQVLKKIRSLGRSGCIFISPCIGACETTDNAPHPQDVVFTNQWGTTTLRPWWTGAIFGAACLTLWLQKSFSTPPHNNDCVPLRGEDRGCA